MSAKKSFVWEYFKGFSADSGKCLRCNEVIIRKSGSTTAMASHLASKHKITKPLEDNREDPIAKKRKITNQTINNFLKKESAEEIIAKCAATNGFSIAGIIKCEPIKGFLRDRGYEMPRSEKTAWNMIEKIYLEKYNEQKDKINEKIINGERFSLSLDEWTDITSKRHVVINLHSHNSSFNLGLRSIPPGSCKSEVLETIVKQTLQESRVDLQNQIVGVTCDGAAVMVKFGNLLQVNVQLCLNHAVHLAVTDVLYKNSPEAEGKFVKKEY